MKTFETFFKVKHEAFINMMNLLIYIRSKRKIPHSKIILKFDSVMLPGKFSIVLAATIASVIASKHAKVYCFGYCYPPPNGN